MPDQIDCEHRQNTLVIHLPKEIDHHSSKEIRNQTEAYLLNANIRLIVFDFSKTTFMDSSGIGVIMGRYRMVHLLGGEVWAVHANERMKKILVMSGVTKIIQIYEEEHV